MAQLSIGDQAPAFTLPGVDGVEHSLSDYEGTPVAVVFSCCHCPYVVAWDGRLNAIAQEYKGRAGLLAVNPNHHAGDTFDAMVVRSAEEGFVFPFLRDESQEVAATYGASRTPEVFLFDAEHRLAYHGAPDSDHGDAKGAEPWFRNALEAVLSGREPELAKTPPVGCTVKWAPS